MKYTIEKIDFDEAVKLPWDVDTCILAQFALRVFGKPLHGIGKGYDNRRHSLLEFKDYTEHPIIGPLVRSFDDAHRIGMDEAKAAIRASLPIEFEIPNTTEIWENRACINNAR